MSDQNMRQIQQLLWMGIKGKKEDGDIERAKDLLHQAERHLGNPTSDEGKCFKIDVIRQLAACYILSTEPADLQKSVDYSLSALNLQEEVQCGNTILSETHLHLAMAEINLGLLQDKPDLLIDAREHLRAGKAIADPGSKQRNQIKEQLHIVTGLLDGNVETHIEFHLPFALYLRPERMDFSVNGTEVTIFNSIETRQHQELSLGDRGRLMKDKWGRLHYSHIHMVIKKIINPHEVRAAEHEMLGERIHIVREEALRYLNYLIERYRYHTGDFFVEKIRYQDIYKHTCKVFSNGRVVKIFSPEAYGTGTGIQVSPSIFISEYVESQIRRDLRAGIQVPIHEILMLNALDHLFQGDYRLSVVETNTAFEMFLNRHIRVRLRNAIPQDELDDFLEGVTIFERCISALEERGYQHIAEKIPRLDADKWRPSVNQMIRLMNKKVPLGISNTKLKKLVSRIRRYRNDVFHGGLSDDDLSPEKVNDSIEALRNFIQLCESTCP